MQPPKPAESAADATVEATEDTTLSEREVARLGGVGTQAIRKATREKRLARCSLAGTAPRYTKEEVERWLDARQRRKDEHRRELVLREGEQDRGATAKAIAVTDLVGQSLDHTKQAWLDTRLMLTEVRKAAGEQIAFYQEEGKRLRARIDKLEGVADDYRQALDVLNKAKYDETIAKAEADIKRSQAKAALDTAKEYAPALFARLLGGEELKQGALSKLMKGMSKQQVEKFIDMAGTVFTPDQFAQLVLLFETWEARDTKEAAPVSPEAAPAANANVSAG